MFGIAGECCAAGEALDAEGRCCAGKLDMCGICRGATKYVDIQGVCCPGMLDSRGLCCQRALDECGICGGRNECITSVRDLSNTVCILAYTDRQGTPNGQRSEHRVYASMVQPCWTRS